MAKKKILRIVLVAVLALVLVAGGAVFGIFWSVIFDANDATISPMVQEETFADWMSYLNEDTKMTDVIMPGSHDAGCVDMNNMYSTQMSGFYDQLVVGTRYFDVRVWKRDGKFGFVHGNSDSYGTSKASDLIVKEELQDIKDFLIANPTEIVILDMQHTWQESEQESLDLFLEVLGRDNCLTTEDFAGSIADVTVGDMRSLGKNVIIVHKNETIVSKDDAVFSREKHIYSPYTRAGHITKDTEEFLQTLDKYILDSMQYTEAFFVLQSQMTGGVGNFNILDRDILIRSELNGYLVELRQDAQKLSALNIVMRDFITLDLGEDNNTAYETIYNILSLNIYKGTIATEKVTEFEGYLLTHSK